MKRKVINHNNTTIKKALLLCGKGWTNSEIAKEYNVSDATIYNWKKRFPRVGIRNVVTRVSKPGALTTAANNRAKQTRPRTVADTTSHEVTITLNTKMHKNLMGLATYEVRTISDQVKYLVHREMERIERNSKNIPF